MEGLMNAQKSSGLKSSKNTAAISPVKLVDEIRKHAYEIHLKQGNNPGSDMDDWLKAEREIKAKYHLS
jgi:hypothetical protein